MFRHILTKKLAGAFAAAGLLAIAQFSAPSLATAAPTIAPAKPYPASVVTSTDLTLAKGEVNAGESNTATARVSSGAGTPTGTVTFQVAGHSKSTVPLNADGSATYTMPTDLAPGKTYKVTARYNGDGIYKASSDAAYVTVRGGPGNGHVGNGQGSPNGNSGGAGGTGENGGNGGNGGGKGRPAPTTGNGGGILGEQATTGGLPGTGSDSSTMLYGLGGLVLLGAGGVALAMNRRRNHA